MLRRAALGLILGTLLATAVASTAEAKAPLCNGEKFLCSRPFNEAILPATHNSMSSQSLGWLIPNQSVAIPEQLKAGIRGLLIDTHYGRLRSDGTVTTDDDGNETDDYGPRGTYLCHEFCEIGSSPLAPVLKSIAKFLKKNPRNVLLIETEDYIEPTDFAAAMKESGLLHYVYRGDVDPKWPTLRKMIKTHQQVVVLGDNNTGSVPWYHMTYQGVLQETPYTFNQPSQLTDPANWPASCGPNRGEVTGSMFLMNHWSPPTPPAKPDPDASAAVNAASVIEGRAKECAKLRGRLPSIIAVDQFTYGGLLKAVHRLNKLPTIPKP